MPKLADLWGEWRDTGAPPPWVLIDAAGFDQGVRDLPESLFSDLRCLFIGDLEDELRDVAPYLARVASLDARVLAGVEDLLQRHVAILVLLRPDSGEAGLPQLHRHFRKHNIVYGPEGQPLFFRYYDPRVLVDVLPALDGEQLQSLFGPVATFVLHDRAGELVRCQLQDGALHVAR